LTAISLPASWICHCSCELITRGSGSQADSHSVVEQPLKIPFVAAIVLNANAQKPEFTTEILTQVSKKVQKHINLGQWREVKLFLRFLGCLQGMFEGDGVFPILDELFSRAADLQMKSSEDVCIHQLSGSSIHTNTVTVSRARAR
jgi:hypothetical protein